jgi:hypothetical protein
LNATLDQQVSKGEDREQQALQGAWIEECKFHAKGPCLSVDCITDRLGNVRIACTDAMGNVSLLRPIFVKKLEVDVSQISIATKVVSYHQVSSMQQHVRETSGEEWKQQVETTTEDEAIDLFAEQPISSSSFARQPVAGQSTTNTLIRTNKTSMHYKGHAKMSPERQIKNLINALSAFGFI